MSKIDDLAKLIVDIIEKKDSKKPRALDTVGTVTRVDGDYAWIRLAGSEEETPVKETITVKKGDKVQVRASKGSAWIVGNETAPPTDDTLAKKALENSDKAGKAAKRASDMTIVNDTLYYLASDQEEGVTVEDEGWTKEPQEVTESLPYLWAYHDYERGNGTHFTSDPVIIAMYAEDGVGVVSVETYYYVSTSQYQLIGGSWGTTYNYVSGTYIWRKELITHDDGTTTWTTALYDSGLTKSLELAYDTAQYIWTQTNTSDTNIPTGQYVTEYPKAQYTNQNHTNYCKGGSLLLRSAVLYLRQGANKLVELVQAGLKIYEPNDSTNPVAQYLSSGAMIGKENSAHVGVNSNGLQFYDSQSRSGGYIGTEYSNNANRLKISASYLNATGNLDVGGNVNVTGNINNNGTVSLANGDLSLSNHYLHTTNNVDVFFENDVECGSIYSYSTAYVEGKLTAGALNQGLFSVESTDITISNSSTGNISNTKSVSKSGYYPLGVVGVNVTTSGAYSRGCYLTGRSSGSATINMRLYASSSGDKECTVYTLWLSV